MSRNTKYLLIHYKANTKLKLRDTRYKIPVASIACSRSVSPFIFCKVDMTVGKVAKIASIDSCLQDHLVSDCLRSLIFFHLGTVVTKGKSPELLNKIKTNCFCCIRLGTLIDSN